MARIRVLAIDPGITTGLALGDVDETGTPTIQPWEAKYEEAALYYMLSSVAPTHIVAESFAFRQNQRDNVELFSRNLLGVSRMYAETRNCVYSEQSPSDAMGFFTDPRLRSLDVYARGKIHARDATRHILYYFAYKAGGKLVTQEYRHSLIWPTGSRD